jgi:hypothetical protein
LIAPLKIDIETILKLLRNESFKELFKTIYKDDLEDYLKNPNPFSKNQLWSFCCVLENIPKINQIIEKWLLSNNLEEVLKTISKTSFKHNIVGQIIKTKSHKKYHKKLLKELKRFEYNSFTMLPINNEHLYLFY